MTNVQDRRRPKRFVVFGGYLTGSDGRKYFVSPLRVMKAYKVDPLDCIIGDPNELLATGGLRHLRGASYKDLIQLWPQPNVEDYLKLPEK
jgi:hypothetical protein